MFGDHKPGLLLHESVDTFLKNIHSLLISDF